MLLTILGFYLYGIEITQYSSYFLVVVLLSMQVTSWGVAIAAFAKTENTGLVMTNMIALGGQQLLVVYGLHLINYLVISK
ncbi:hypothetical protein BsIDN1_30530 [Bacillus safensis]|uniref:Uncharacterized protein n=1 Tax=Bacillus safensis TaxID=561879 RepID=A0A5S9M9A0_BACIA|nr:hypothetical protein BsIDN1_30530 [Bacillus safensis]